LRLACDNLDVLFFDEVFRAAREFSCVTACGQLQLLSVCAIDLRMKAKVRSQPLHLRRIDTTLSIANDEGTRCGFAVLIRDTQRYFCGRHTSKQDVHIVSKSDILGSLTYIETDLGFTLAGVTTVELNDPVF